MKNKNKKSTDHLLHSLIRELKRSGTRCGTGAEMDQIRAQQKK